MRRPKGKAASEVMAMAFQKRTLPSRKKAVAGKKVVAGEKSVAQKMSRGARLYFQKIARRRRCHGIKRRHEPGAKRTSNQSSIIGLR